MDAQTRARLLGLANTETTAPIAGDYYDSSDPKCKRALEKMGDARVNVLPTRNAKSARTNEDNVQRGAVCALRDALCHMFTTDAHMQTAIVDAFIKDDTSPRIAKEAIKNGCVIEVLSFDFDLNDHASGRMTDETFKTIVTEMQSSPILSGAVYYATRGGLRALVPLSEPFEIRTDNGEDWTAFYTQIVQSLPSSSLGAWDIACGDVPRLYRLPRVIRDNEPQKGLIYVPHAVMCYALTSRDREAILNASLPKSATTSAVEGDGLISFFDEIGMLGEEHTEINGAPSYLCTCPFEHLHSSSNPTSTVLMSVGEGYTLHCLHGSCKQYTQSGAWKRHLQTLHPDEWGEFIGAQSSEYQYSPTNPNEFVRNAVSIINAVYTDRMFRRFDDIVTIERDAYGGATWSTWSADDLTGLLNRSAQWVTLGTDREGNTVSRPTNVPVKAVREQRRAIRDALPICEQRTVIPPLDPETMMPTRFSEGYCHVTRSYFLPHPSLDLRALKEACDRAPSRDRALVSYLSLTDLYVDFPWRSEAHRALAVGATMTAVMRRAIDVAPLWFVSANNKGVGKTKLLSSVLASVYGETPPLSALPERGEELKKTLDSIVASNIDYYVFDNVNGKMGGAELDGFITSARHQYRPLGSSQVRAGVQCTFLGATGNNATINGDTDRRAIIMRLVTPLENPEMRTGFRYRDLIGTARERVTQTWIAVIEILRAYFELSTAEERRQIARDARQLGSFEQWCDYVRDPLMWVASLVHGQTVDIVALSAQEMDDARGDDRAELFDVLIEWQANRDRIAKQRGSEWTSKAFADALRNATQNESGDYLDEFGSTLSSCSVQYVGRVLSARRDQVGQGYRLESRRKGGKMLWRMVCVDPSQSPDPEPTERESLPILNNTERCEGRENIDVPADILAHDPAYTALTKRCVYLRDRVCAKYKVDCEYDATGGITETLKQSLSATLPDAISALRSPRLPLGDEIDGDDARAVEIVNAEVQVKRTQAQIAERLNAEGIAPPKGRKWTSAKVGLLIKRNQITRPRAEKKSKSDRIIERDGHWADYWSTDHPLTQPTFTTDEPTFTTEGGERTVSASALLTRVYGRVMDCRKAFIERVQRDERDED